MQVGNIVALLAQPQEFLLRIHGDDAGGTDTEKVDAPGLVQGGRGSLQHLEIQNLAGGINGGLVLLADILRGDADIISDMEIGVFDVGIGFDG